jgi:hypothetical protein
LVIQILEGKAMDCKRNSVVGGIVCAAVILCCVNGLGAIEFAGGTGEPNDPYQIATAEQLIAIGSDPNLAKSQFVLTASIDLSGTTWWSAVIPSFSGSLDGNGFAIRGFTARGIDSLGLFERIDSAGRVANLRMEDVDLTGVGYVGALAAHNAGAVYDCVSTGVVISTGSTIGGLIGYNAGIVAGSSSAVQVTGNGPVGGLVGSNARGILADCHSAGAVLGYSYVGGLAGSSDGSITGCYADVEVIGASGLGGLVGRNLGLVRGSYSAGSVAGGNDAGGLVGSNEKTIHSSYSVSEVTSRGKYVDPRVGGLVGRGANLTMVVKDSYFLAPSDGGGPDNKIGKPLTIAQLTQQASFPAWDFWGTDADGAGDPWFMPVDSFPVLAWQTEVTGLRNVPNVTGLPLERAQAALTAAGFVPGDVRHDFHRTLPAGCVIHAEPHSVLPFGATVGLVASSGQAYDWAANPGDGTLANPYQIGTAGQLESLADHSELWDKHFVLTADLDLTGRVYTTALISPGTWTTTGFSGTAFTGSFDGQGHAIRSLFIETENRGYAGLFGVIGDTGQVSNLSLPDAVVKTPSTSGTATRSGAVTAYFGVLAGGNYGQIASCSATGIVMSRYTDDGFVGVNRGSVTDCSVDVVVTGSTAAR